ncbi:hypothetical protein CCZ01_00055 [Helicobacter monodelphidis]|uniref:6-hydroxymethylpterin diphosphokinase MptE-like protein n=1 Tax=Helicobacter sp. 15-1451 TaxID=2004995 RepID=UPI000DCCB4D2|nr:6-hydroxymethylpterin diphosphokinase MptE-like protein [Helicobacter sp. 15-1451]RAX59178.1 hypothetical protein CCZ01_00055 [Helicobacter sp. 15-1451]
MRYDSELDEYFIDSKQDENIPDSYAFLESLQKAQQHLKVENQGLGHFFNTLESNNEQAIGEAINQRMIDNLNFFSQQFPDMIKSLSKTPKDYNLVLNDKGLNIVNIHDGSLLYPEDENGQYTMVQSAKYLSESPLTHPLWKLYTNDLRISYLSKKDFPITSRMHNALCYAAIPLGILKEGMHLPSRFLPTTTLLGLGGGLILEAIRERFDKIHSLFIFEESIDLFRISCYFVDYIALFQQVNNNACYLFVESLLKQSFVQSFFEQRRISSNYLRLELMLYQTPTLQSVQSYVNEAYMTNARGWGTFDDERRGLENALQNMQCKEKKEGVFLLKYPFFSSARRIAAPFCVVGNGPSLDSLLPFIKANSDRMVILSSGTAIKPLLNYGIKPDFQIEIERVDYLHTAFEGLNLSGIPLVCANLVNPKVLELFDEVFLFSRDGSSAAELHSPKLKLFGASPFVGNASAAFAAMLASDVIFCGVDCGYILGYGKHAKGSFYGEEEATLPKDSFPAKPNKDKQVFSDALFSNSRENIEGVLRMFQPNTAINLGDGAFIQGTISADSSDFVLKKIDKKHAIKEFKRLFTIDCKQAFLESVKNIYQFSNIDYFDNIIDLFDVKVETKEDLFNFIDQTSNRIWNIKKESAYWGILMNGSIAFYVQILMLCALAIPSNNIEKLFNEARIIYRREVKYLKKVYLKILEEYPLQGKNVSDKKVER